MSIEEIIDQLMASNIRVKVDGDDLKLVGIRASVAPDLLAEIRANKAALIEFYKSARVANHLVDQIPVAAYQEDGYLLSSAQRRLWATSQEESRNVSWNTCFAYTIDGDLDYPALDRSFHSLLDRHEILRTVFRKSGNSEVRQSILPAEDTSFSIDYYDMRKDPDSELAISQIIQKEVVKPFHLEKGPLFRVYLFRSDMDRYVLMYAIHHIISDGWSMLVLNRDLMTFYNAYSQGQMPSLQPLRVQYKDYAAWEQQQMEGERWQRHRAYWIRQLSGDLPLLDLPSHKQRPPRKSYKGGIIKWEIPEDLATGINLLRQKSDATLFMSLLALLNILIYRYSGSEDIIIGTATAGREHRDLGDMIGFFVNMLAVRVRFSGSDSFYTLLEKVKKESLDAFEHQAYPIDELIKELNIKAIPGRGALCDVHLTVQNNSLDTEGEAGDAGLVIKGYKGGEHLISKSDMTLTFRESGKCILGSLEYSTDLFDAGSMERFTRHFNNMLAAVVNTPEMAVSKLPYLSREETATLLHKFNDTAFQFPPNETLTEVFEEHAKLHPDGIALVDETAALSYKQLNEKANQVAHYLRDTYGVKPGERIAVRIGRSNLAVIAILGVMKSGAAFLPIDVSHPEERICAVLQDSGCRIVLTEERLQQVDGKMTNPVRLHCPEDLSYMIYTSGSTGTPRGVNIPHSGIYNTVHAAKKSLCLGKDNKGLQFASLAFDAAIWDIFLMLTSCGTLYIIPEEKKRDPDFFEAFVNKHSIDFVTLPPAFLNVLDPANMPSLKQLVTAGEPAVCEKVKLFSQYLTYINAYGPTETSICATMYMIEKGGKMEGDHVPIGVPNANTKIYILDDRHMPVPIGVTGEIAIGGAGLASGYWNNPIATQEKFIPNPMDTNERIYLSGDLGKWLPDGNLVIQGRKDDQLKVRGYRVEPDEIAHVLQGFHLLQQVVVTAHHSPGDEKYLVAYFTADSMINIAELKTYAARILPDYMVPARFVQLEYFPVLSSGKVDRKALPELCDVEAATTEILRPQNSVEEKLTGMWAEILGMPADKISVNADFFLLGGNSINIITLAGKINQIFGVSYPLNQLYDEPVITIIAKSIQQQLFRNGDTYVFNKEQSHRIFCMPPIAGNAISYDLLAECLPEYCLCCFDYVVTEDPVKYFADRIIGLSNCASYTLLGYSAGGKILYPVARELERRGKVIDQVIILDGFWNEFHGEQDDNWAYPIFDPRLRELKLEAVRDEFYQRLYHYDKLINNIRFGEKLSSDIHFVISEGQVHVESEEKISSDIMDLYATMPGHTHKLFTVHKGYGVHGQLLHAGFVERNAAVVKNILELQKASH
ncbi:non-ribosomal peptide synthetase [Chitinophaga varians]|uniref:non-ribosomal peptide synthetase n=1 Tax=Chitinophaga varians TaxID=2202339 RepID=UPI00165F8EBD|nr:non-ribosomal peptide synthetase [Chitinophaga varians]MBC9914693.1 amino acid adenylation domain-containing protein [Chitinophaga varians]